MRTSSSADTRGAAASALERHVHPGHCKLGVSPQSLRNSARQAETDAGEREALTSDERARLRQLERENRILREEREILKKAVSQQTLRNWRRQDQLDRHERNDGVTSDERQELVHGRSWPTRRELISEAYELVEAFYNTTRRHFEGGPATPRRTAVHASRRARPATAAVHGRRERIANAACARALRWV